MHNLATTYLRIVFAIAFVFGPVFTGWMASLLDFRMVFVCMSALMFLIAAYSYLFIKKMEKEEKPYVNARDGESDSGYLTGHSKSRPFFIVMLVLLSLIFMRAADSTRNVYLPLVFMDKFGDSVMVASMFSISAFSEFFFMFFLAIAAVNFGERNVIMVSSAIGAIYFSLLAFVDSPVILYAIQVLYAVIASSMLGVAMVYTQNAVKDRVGFANSLYMATLQVGTLFGYLFPLLVQGYHQYIFIIPSIFCVTSIFLLWSEFLVPKFASFNRHGRYMSFK